MRSEWRIWPDLLRRSWRTASGAKAHVLYQLLGGERVEQDDGIRGPKEFTYIEFPDDKTRPYYVIECDHTGPDLTPRIVAVHVIARDPLREVRPSDLRELRLDDAVEAAAERAFSQAAMTGEKMCGPADLSDRPPTEAPIRQRVQGLRTRNRRGVTLSMLKEVAETYRTALKTGAPTKAVREHFSVSPATASTYVRKAREAGLDMGSHEGQEQQR